MGSVNVDDVEVTVTEIEPTPTPLADVQLGKTVTCPPGH